MSITTPTPTRSTAHVLGWPEQVAGRSSGEAAPELSLARPIVVVGGDPSGSIPLADVVLGWRELGRTFVLDVHDGDRAGALDRLLGDTPVGGTSGDVTLALQTTGVVGGLGWARRHPERLRAVVLVDPVIRPLTKRELLATGVDRAEQEDVRDNAAWLASSHVPKLLVSTRPGAPSTDVAALDWASTHVRNLTIEQLNLDVGAGDHLGRSVRAWLGHISWG